MPRKSFVASLVPHVDGSPPQLQPPASLSPAERKVFADLVAGSDRKHFRKTDLPLLCAYVRAIDLEIRSAKFLAKNPAENGTVAAKYVAFEYVDALGRAVWDIAARPHVGSRSHERDRTVFQSAAGSNRRLVTAGG